MAATNISNPKKQLNKCKHTEYWNELQKKMKIVKPGDNVMVPMPDLDRTKIDAHILPVLIVEEYSNGNGVRFC